jgi:Flp pilus assembly protein TadB
MVDYYSILDISTSASEEEIRRAYRRKAKEYHPDVNNSEDAHHRFVLIQKAYQILNNPYSKSNYDSQRRGSDPLHSYQDWVARQRERQAQEARRKYQDQLKRKEEIRKSKLFYPYVVGLYVVSIAILAGCTAILIGCAVIMIKMSLFMFFFLLPFICVALYVLKFTYDKFKEERQLFAALT